MNIWCNADSLRSEVGMGWYILDSHLWYLHSVNSQWMLTWWMQSCCSQGKDRVELLQPLGTFSSTGQYWTLFYACLCLKTAYSINICCCLINTYLLTTAAELTPEQRLPSAPKAHPASSHSAGLDCTSAICLGAIINSEITNKKHKTLKMMALNRPWKGHWLTVGELKQKGKEQPCPTWAGSVCRGTQCSVTLPVCEWPWKNHGKWSWVTNTF